MKIVEAALLPSCLGEEVDGGNSCFNLGESVVDENSMVDGHGPKSWVCNFGPMGGGV